MDEDYWNTIADAYQQGTRISVEDFHYGPLLPGDRRLGLLPEALDGLRCLEIGSGAGQNSLYLASRGAECIAFDASARQLEHGRVLAEGLGLSVDYREADMDGLAWTGWGPFDLVHSTYALPFSEDPAAVIEGMARVLRPGGQLLLTTGHPVYSGQWVELGDEPDGLFLASYFQPEPDSREPEEGRPAATSWFHPIGAVAEWMVEAGLCIERLLEPEPLPIPDMEEAEIQAEVPYESDEWRTLYPILREFPTVVIFRARKGGS